MTDNLGLVSSKVWDLEDEHIPIIDIPEQGFDYNLVNKYPNGFTFTGKHHDNTYAQYTIIDKEFKKVNLT